MIVRAGFALFFFLLVTPASAELRVALVVGNSAYQHAAVLANPRNDAAAMSAIFRKYNIQVIEGFDLDKVAFDRRISDFENALLAADAGLFFYAGHGLQVDGKNYLVPVDAELASASALDGEMISLDSVLRTMEGRAKTKIIFLDACRNNPLTRNLARALGTPAIGRGLAAVKARGGTLISFSTEPGNIALDGQGPNSPFTGALVRRISHSLFDLGSILIAVRNDVIAATGGQQVPWEHSALTGKFYFDLDARNAEAEGRKFWRSLRQGQIATAVAADGRQLTCVGGNTGLDIPRKCRYSGPPAETKTTSIKNEIFTTPHIQPQDDAKWVAVIASMRTSTDAGTTGAEVEQIYKSVLRDKRAGVRRVDLHTKGVWYRVTISPLRSRDAVLEFCTALKGAGYPGDCWPAQN